MTNTYYVIKLDGLAKVDTVYNLESIKHDIDKGTITIVKKEADDTISHKFNDSKYALIPAVVYDYA